MIESTDKIIDFFLNHPNSPFSKIKELGTPENDHEYFSLWFHYMEFRKNGISIEEINSRFGIEPARFSFTIQLKSRIQDIFNRALDGELNNLSFIPRLEKYLDEFPDKDRYNTRLLILAYIHKSVHEHGTYDALRDLAREYDIPRDYVLSIDSEHKLVKDHVIEFNSNSTKTAHSQFDKELDFNPIIYKLFTGSPIASDEISQLRNSYLIDLFDIPIETHTYHSYLTKDEIESPEEESHDEINIQDIGTLFNGSDKEGLCLTGPQEDKISEETESEEIRPYTDNTEYLRGEYLWMKPMVIIWDESKDSYFSTKDENLQKIRQLEKEQSRYFELASKRLEKSIEAGFKPKFIFLAEQLGLSKFERNALKLLLLNQIFLGNFNDVFRSDKISIGNLVSLLIKDPVEQVQSRKKFSKSSKLRKSGLVNIDSYGYLDDNIWDWYLRIDHRLSDFVMGEEFDIGEYIEGGELRIPQVKLENVILPEESKSTILKSIDKFRAKKNYKNHVKYDVSLEYGNALVFAFLGPPGCGKTMLANAIANELNKKILVFNLKSISRRLSDIQSDNVFSLLFREARINNCIIFFDESEGLLETRIPELLIELQKHDGIVIFATNADLDIVDEMNSRIRKTIIFDEPGPALREKIWRMHLPNNIKFTSDVNITALSKKFELTGRQINFAISSAIDEADIGPDSDEPVLSMKNFETGAMEQLQNKLYMSRLRKDVSLFKNMEDIVLDPVVKRNIKEIINHKNAEKVLNGEWDFREKFPDEEGISVLFYGASGTGKTLAAKVIAHETGKRLRVVNTPQILSMWVGQTEKNLEYLFKEYTGSDDIILFDEGDALFTRRVAVNSSNDRYANIETDVLLGLIENSSLFAIITTNYSQNIDPAFMRRFNYTIEFPQPDSNLRIELWKKLMPTKFPLNACVNLEKLAFRYPVNGGDIKKIIKRVGNLTANKSSKNRFATMSDFEAVAEEVVRSKKNGMATVGYKK